MPQQSKNSGISISCESITAGYLGSKVLRDISFKIEEPAVYVVLGPNGAGKTTLFRTLSGILQPYQGEVYVGGEPINLQSSRNRLHYLSHTDGVPDDLQVSEALQFYSRVEHADSADIDRVLELFEMRDLRTRYLSQLSAGQKKRVSISRVFLRERAIYLLDEPTANLDPKLAREIRSLILEMSHDKIVLYSSHNLFEAREIGHYILAIKDGQLAIFDRIDNIKSSHFVIGIRLLEPSEVLADWKREGEYYIRELQGPNEVPLLLRDIDSRGVRIRELREMGNPLEDLFK